MGQGLNKNIIPVDLTAGLDTKSNDRTMIPGKLTRAENVEIKKRNKIQKRDGYADITHTGLDAAALPGGKALGVFNNELLRIIDGKLYAFSDAGDVWVERGRVSPAHASTRHLSSLNDYPTGILSRFSYDHAVSGQYLMYATENKIAVYDLSTGTTIDSFSTDPGPAAFGIGDPHNGARCVVYNDKLYCLYFENDNDVLDYYTFDTTDPDGGITDNGTLKASQTDSPLFFDLVNAPTPDKMFIVKGTSADGDVRLISWQGASGNTDIGVNVDGGDDNHEITNVSCIYDDANDRIYVFYRDRTDNLFGYFVRDSSLTEVLAPTTIEATPDDEPFNITGVLRADGTVDVFYDKWDSTNSVSDVITRTVDYQGNVGTASTFAVRSQIASKAFMRATDQPCIFVMRYADSAPYQNIFLLELDATDGPIVISRHVADKIDQYEDDKMNMSSVSQDSAGVFRFLVDVAGFPEAFKSTTLIEVEFSGKNRFAVQHGPGLVIGGGYLSFYDGDSTSELNFFDVPFVSKGGTSTSGGDLDDAVYQYIALYEWSDARGKLHQSAPSNIMVANHSGSSSGTNVTQTIKALADNLTFKENLRIAYFRTEGNGEIFYYLSAATINAKTDVYVPYDDLFGNDDDSFGDSLIISNRILYTTGDILENFQPPPARMIHSFKGRLFLVDSETRGRIRYSHKHEDGFPTRFSADLYLDIDHKGKEPSGIGSISEYLLVFFDDSFFYTYGDGPNTQGQVGEFSPFQKRGQGVGCQDPKSIIETPLGVIVKSPKGFYLIDAQLSSSYIGAEVEDFNSETVTSAVIVPNRNRVRFTTEDGSLLEYDWEFGQWFTRPGLDAYDGVAWGDDYVILRKTDADVLVESEGAFQDAGEDYLMLMETGWISLAGVVNWQRIYRLFINGERLASHSFKVSVAYDYSSTYAHSVTLDPDTALDDGSSGFYPFEMSIHLKKQKCQAIRFKIEELSPAGTKESFSITAIGLQFGAKKGLAKVRSAQKKGTS